MLTTRSVTLHVETWNDDIARLDAKSSTGPTHTLLRKAIDIRGDDAPEVTSDSVQTFKALTNGLILNGTGGLLIDPTDAWYKGIYYPKHGVLIVSNARSPRYAVEQKKRVDEWEGGDLVPLGLLSDVMFLEYEHLCKTTQPPLNVKDLRYMFRSQIVNKETREVIFEVLKRRGVVNGPVPWPGTAFKFPSEKALALLSTPNGRGAAWILISHRAELGWKTIKQITVFDNLLSAGERSVFREWSHPSMLIEFEDSSAPQQDEPGGGKQEQ
ncbi:hypothetical protein KC354_g5075 [Hortaea werneckii]|nr:hypothetical protein KC354_g5075 [Hortaea werneckii]